MRMNPFNIRSALLPVVILALSSCSSIRESIPGGTPGPSILWGTAWVLEDLAGVGVMDWVQATLAFPEPGKVSGNGSCNEFHGDVDVKEDAIAFGTLVATRKRCVDAVNQQESQYFAALAKAERFEIDQPFLYIYSAGLDRPLRFIRVVGE